VYNPDLLNGGFDKWIACYGQRPFAVFSSAWPKIKKAGEMFYALKRPDYPVDRLFPSAEKNKRKAMEQKKDNLKKKWLLVPESLHVSLTVDYFITDEEMLALAFQELTGETRKAMRGKSDRQFMTKFINSHNTINRMTMTTGGGMFSPYSEAANYYYPETELAIFILLDEEATDIDRLMSALERIGQTGFGRNASIGCGKYTLGKCEEKKLPSVKEADACYNLAPAIPEKKLYKDCWFTPFTRFGRHGSSLAASKNPFKNPVIMADEGAVLIPADRSVFSKPYLGCAANNISKVLPGAVSQGYSFYLPFKLEQLQ
jgi:CRISPR-associated protein Csm4